MRVWPCGRWERQLGSAARPFKARVRAGDCLPEQLMPLGRLKPGGPQLPSEPARRQLSRVSADRQELASNPLLINRLVGEILSRPASLVTRRDYPLSQDPRALPPCLGEDRGGKFGPDRLFGRLAARRSFAPSAPPVAAARLASPAGSSARRAAVWRGPLIAASAITVRRRSGGGWESRRVRAPSRASVLPRRTSAARWWPGSARAG